MELNSYQKELGFFTPKLNKEQNCIFQTSSKKKALNQQQNFNIRYILNYLNTIK